MRALLIAVMVGSSLSGWASAQQKEAIRLPGVLEGLPFSAAVRVGDLLFLSGQIGIDFETQELVPGGIGPETRKTMENIRSVLEYVGSSFESVVKCTVFLVDMAEWPGMNEVYRTFFASDPPARSAVAGSGLALGARVEIECIAVVGE